MINLVKFKLFFEEFSGFVRVRLGMLLYSNSLAFLFIDFFGWSFLRFTLVFTPLSALINFYFYKKIFKGKKGVVI